MPIELPNINVCCYNYDGYIWWFLVLCFLHYFGLKIWNSWFRLIIKSCRYIIMWFCKMSINLQSSARLHTPDVRTKWISFKFSGFLPWRNSMQVPCNAITVLRMNVLDLQKQITSNAWWRSDTITVLCHFVPATCGVLYSVGVHGDIETNFSYFVSIFILSGNETGRP